MEEYSGLRGSARISGSLEVFAEGGGAIRRVLVPALAHGLVHRLGRVGAPGRGLGLAGIAREADRAVEAGGEAVQARLRVVQRGLGIERERVRGDRSMVELQAGVPSAVEHPAQRDVGQAGGRIAAADVAVRPAEPDLLDRLPLLGLVRPQRRLEGGAVLVDGQGVAGPFHGGAELRVVELVLAACESSEAAQRDAERADGVPDADEPHADGLGAAHRVVRPERPRPLVVGMLVVPVQLARRLVVLDRVAPEDAALADHAHDAARGERAAAEAEEEQLVVGLVVADEEAVGIVDVVLQALAERAPGHAIDEVPGADTLIVVEDLRNAPRALGGPVGEPHDVGRAGNALALLIGAVPRAVAADNQTLHFRRLTPASARTYGARRRRGNGPRGRSAAAPPSRRTRAARRPSR